MTSPESARRPSWGEELKAYLLLLFFIPFVVFVWMPKACITDVVRSIKTQFGGGRNLLMAIGVTVIVFGGGLALAWLTLP